MNPKHLIITTAIILLMFAGTASAATDYYVSTTGDNTTQGNITHPWQNVSYATSQATAGDTIHLFDGTWYDEEVMFTNNGTAGSPITLTAYNGTPTMTATTNTTYAIQTYYDGSYHARQYINISDLTITDYHSSIYIRKSNNVHVSNCTVNIRSKADGNHAGIAMYDGSSIVSIDGCTVIGDGWNALGINGRYEAGGAWYQVACDNVSITNCVVYDNTHHNLVDIKGNVTDVDIIGNTLYNCDYNGFYTHQGSPLRVNFSNNLIYNLSLDGILMYMGVDCTITNNTIYDVQYGARGYYCTNCIYQDNTIYDLIGNGIYHYNTSTSIGNRIYGTVGTEYRFSYGINTLRDSAHTGAIRCTVSSAADEIIEYTDGKIFVISSISGANYTYTHPQWYPDIGNASFITDGPDTIIFTLTHYNVTLQPTNAYLKNVSVNHESVATDDRTNITVNSSAETNPTWINATMQHASTNYSISVDGVHAAYVDSDADGVVCYQYTSSWSEHDFEIEWTEAQTFSADTTRLYYNAISPILNTEDPAGNVTHNRTLTAYDTLAKLNMSISATESSAYTLWDYYADSNADSKQPIRNASGNINYVSQSFIADASYNLSKVRWNMSKDTGHPGTFYCYLYGAAGIAGTDAYPDANLLATSNAESSTITTTPGLVNFTFPGGHTLTKDTAYTVVMFTTQPSSYNAYVHRDATSPTFTDGNYAIHIGGDAWGTWTSGASRDYIFYNYGYGSAGIDTISGVVLEETETNLSRWNVTDIQSQTSFWNVSYSNTTNGYTYYLKFDNDTEILNQTATGDDQELWFNHTSLLPVGIYKITGSALSGNDIILAANTYGFLCEDPSIAHPFNMIAAEFDHEICFSWLNNSGECWESYWSGDSYNSEISIPKNDAYFVLMDGTGETVSCGVRAAGNVAIPVGWYATYLGESTAKTLTQIKTDMQVDGTVTDLYTWDHNAGGTGAWVDVDVTPSHSVLPNQGILINNMGAPYNWDGTVS